MPRVENITNVTVTVGSDVLLECVFDNVQEFLVTPSILYDTKNKQKNNIDVYKRQPDYIVYFIHLTQGVACCVHVSLAAFKKINRILRVPAEEFYLQIVFF